MGFLTYGLLCSFCFPLGILDPLAYLGFLGLFPNFVFSWAFTDFIGLLRSNYFILIFGVYGPTINPLLSLLTLLWACRGPFLLFFHIIHCLWVCYLLFLSFRALLSPFAFSRPIYLFYGPMIYYSCRLDLMVFVLYLLPTSFRSVLLGWDSSSLFGFYKKDPQQILNRSHLLMLYESCLPWLMLCVCLSWFMLWVCSPIPCFICSELFYSFTWCKYFNFLHWSINFFIIAFVKVITCIL